MTDSQSILDQINSPDDLRKVPIARLDKLAAEIRKRIDDVVSRTGGHLASNLGVVELTIALHYCFDFRKDRLLWDVGHQSYVHKLLTGRRERFDDLRQAGGLSGFPAPSESEYDLFAVGHAGTAISTAMGMATADQKLGRDNAVVAFVGDASIVNGLAFEGLNNAGLLKRQFLVVLNDNSMAIDVTQGALAKYLAKVRTNHTLETVRKRGEAIIEHIPLVGKSMHEMIRHLKQAVKSALWPDLIYEQMGFTYLGPVDGHDLKTLIGIFRSLRGVNHPVVLHTYTEKGRGHAQASQDPCAFHSPAPFVIESGKAVSINGESRTWTRAFSDKLIELANADDRIVALTAAMPDGTGLDRFKDAYPDRYFDVGIAESHAVAMAAGLARAGLKPVVAIYSTFLQRGFDQVFQEAALQNLPIVFCMDRAGLCGSDGPVHHGFADVALMRALPGMTVMAPADEGELRAAMDLAVTLPGPSAIRYPRAGVGSPAGSAEPFVLGRSRVLRAGVDATIIGYGVCAADALVAAEQLAAQDGVQCEVISARFAKPIDAAMVERVLSRGRPVIVVEDHLLAGGFGAALLECAADGGLDTRSVVRLGLPDRWVDAAPRRQQLAEVGIDAAGIARAVREQVAAAGRVSTIRHAG
ncbi:MAG: 1-deoxy-D-xylulose-5-phosphate synthase [Phycisphaerae bacterium]|nr:1-deoxy-D-xylulose-5-phosphate synthase [Phycisphaerae bacterium]